MHFKYRTIDDDEAQYTPSTFSPVKLATILTLANVEVENLNPSTNMFVISGGIFTSLIEENCLNGIQD